jgi:hypothetical protein
LEKKHVEREQVSTARNELANWLVQRFDATEPRVQVDSSIAAAKQELLDDTRLKKAVYARPAYVGEILWGIHWKDAPPDAEWCGVKLLSFMGEMAHAAHKYDVDKIPLLRVIEMLMYCYHGGDLRLRCEDKQRWIQSRPEFSEKFGFRVRVRVPRCNRLADSTFELDDLPVM